MIFIFGLIFKLFQLIFFIFIVSIIKDLFFMKAFIQQVFFIKQVLFIQQVFIQQVLFIQQVFKVIGFIKNSILSCYLKHFMFLSFMG